MQKCQKRSNIATAAGWRKSTSTGSNWAVLRAIAGRALVKFGEVLSFLKKDNTEPSPEGKV
ncbi:MAG: hypothetical protein A3A26_02055 [Candidatus Zambryskibacteria bacterium RIFCSPLOWO2_01_FULL_47_14]|uniref:Uncharacterized protein n=1 Tax=Candidatus Zambryskibacteria bacterium RIFCSPLOWO2_01_FULL_47_14 TaxID=1802763 RepID=A0A1G2U8M1_9BACT|nr:MAG: hypothetical protein A3A26_02055 [Candidatus Zambryskibacteria bacterium RIFCSPLOWO2_01_FULL_47_14]